MEYVDITKCYEVLMNYIDEDFMNGHEEQCKNHFLSYIQENNGDELKHKNGTLLVPAYFYSGKYILDYIKKSTNDFSAKDCAYLALNQLGIPPIDSMSLASLEKTIRGLIKDKAYVKRINGTINTLCVDKDTACSIANHPDVRLLINKQISKAELVHEDSVEWRAYEFVKKKIEHQDCLSDERDNESYVGKSLSDTEKTYLMVKALYDMFFTEFDFGKYEAYCDEMSLLADAWDFGERYQELYDIFSAPNYKYEFFKNTMQDNILDSLTDRIADKIIKKLNNN